MRFDKRKFSGLLLHHSQGMKHLPTAATDRQSFERGCIVDEGRYISLKSPRKVWYNGALYGLGCTTFASPPFFAEVMIPENTVILPEQIAVFRRESMR
jgi:hypothetical protein